MKTIKSREYYEGGIIILNALEAVNSQVIADKHNSDSDKLKRILNQIRHLKAVWNKRANESISVRLAK
jgi:valyl-tRNA synthetase